MGYVPCDLRALAATSRISGTTKAARDKQKAIVPTPDSQVGTNCSMAGSGKLQEPVDYALRKGWTSNTPGLRTLSIRL